MVIIEQLRISDDGQTLYLNARVNEASYFDNVYISKVTICTEEQVSELHPESYGEDFVFQDTFNDRSISLVLCSSTLNEKFTKTDLSHNMFFVYIECDGTPAPDTPCLLDCPALGVTFDYGVLYNQAMNYTAELADTCDINKSFIDFILNMEALKMSLETEHYIPAIKYWKRLLGVSSNNLERNTCNCHG